MDACTVAPLFWGGGALMVLIARIINGIAFFNAFLLVSWMTLHFSSYVFMFIIIEWYNKMS